MPCRTSNNSCYPHEGKSKNNSHRSEFYAHQTIIRLQLLIEDAFTKAPIRASTSVTPIKSNGRP